MKSLQALLSILFCLYCHLQIMLSFPFFSRDPGIELRFFPVFLLRKNRDIKNPTTDVYFETCITKPCQVGHRQAFWMLSSSDYKVLRSTVIALYNCNQYSHCQAVQLFRLTRFLIKALTTIISEHIVYPCVDRCSD